MKAALPKQAVLAKGAFECLFLYLKLGKGREPLASPLLFFVRGSMDCAALGSNLLDHKISGFRWGVGEMVVM